MWKEEGKKPILEFLIWTFLISLGCELIIIGLERSGTLPTNVEKLFVMILIGLGAGLAPVYGSFIILRRHQRITGIHSSSCYSRSYLDNMAYSTLVHTQCQSV